MNELAEWYKVGGDWKKSLEIFTAASETTDMAIASMEDKKMAKATLNDIRCRSYRGIAFNQVELKQWDKARIALKQCLALIPNDPKSKGELEYIKANTGK
jgi:Flp pilus assembly protein TadD